MRDVWPNQSAAANRRPALQPDGSDNLSAIVAAARAFPAAVAELLVVRRHTTPRYVRLAKEGIRRFRARAQAAT